jgi:hypothetical protein
VSSSEPRPYFFRPEGDALIPQPETRGPWGQTMHGRMLGGLVAREAQKVMDQDSDLFCSRLTIDMFRSIGLIPLTVATRSIREGRRIRVLEVSITSDGDVVGQGIAVLLRKSEQPPGEHRGTPAWSAPTPAQIGPPVSRPTGAGGFAAPWDSWPIAGEGADKGMRGGMWMRDKLDLVQGEPLTGLVRLGLASDLASPIANASTEGLGFINADYTVYLAREPVGEIIGIQPVAHLSELGIAVSQSVAHDDHGPVGFISNTGLANSMSQSQADNPPPPPA